MTTLIKTEWLKMKKYNAFWWIIGITALSYPGINYIFYQFYDEMVNDKTQIGMLAKAIANPFSFPEVWHTVAYASSYFVFIPAVVVIMLISNEYSFRTHRQNIIDGWSRKQFVTSKLVDVLLISLLITALCAIVAFFIGIANQQRLIQDTWGEIKYIGLFFIQTFAQLSLAFLIGFLIRKAFLALGVFLFYFLILENLAIGLLHKAGSNAGEFLPLNISHKIIVRPTFTWLSKPKELQDALNAVPLHIILTIILTTIVWGICYWVNNRRDLK